MSTVRIADALAGKIPIGTAVTVKGWVRTRRDSKAGVSFVHVSDGSCFDPIQVVAPNSLANYASEIQKITSGCAVIATGELIASPAKGQSVEIQASSITVAGWIDDPETYPIQPKKHSFEYLREMAHLRPRTDTYGGSVENRTRLLFEVAEALIRIWGPDRIGVRLSPMGRMNDIHDDQPEATFGYIAERLSDYRFAYLHIVNPAMEQMQSEKAPDPRALAMVEMIRKRFKGTLMVAGGFQADTAAQWLREGRADLIAFGRKFIANPDLPERLRIGAPFNADDPTTYYGGGEKGYTDYPSLAQDRGEQPKACVDQRWR
jgi:hypothetical protein